jgi:hypothetical protein
MQDGTPVVVVVLFDGIVVVFCPGIVVVEEDVEEGWELVFVG